MTKPNPDSPAEQVQALSIPARLLLFCVAAPIDWGAGGRHSRDRYHHGSQGAD
jgi:hypothetical protein